MKDFFKKKIINKEKLINMKLLSPVKHLLTMSILWKYNKYSVAKGVAIGIFTGCLPIIGQMISSIFLAIFFKANIPISLLSTWISNPISMPFLYTFNYYIGTLILNTKYIDIKNIEWSFDKILSFGGDIITPLFLGSLVVGTILSFISYFITVIVLGLRKKKKLIQLRKRKKKGN